MSEELDLAALFEETKAWVARNLAPVEWAEDEARKAEKEHPDEADRIYHAINLCWTERVGPTEMAFRSHCRELLERVAAGEDTRPATDAELCWVCCETSLAAPLTESGAGLYARLWARAFPEAPQMFDARDVEFYESRCGVSIDEHERKMRRRFAQPARKLGEIHCAGMHWGEPATCRFAKGEERPCSA